MPVVVDFEIEQQLNDYQRNLNALVTASEILLTKAEEIEEFMLTKGYTKKTREENWSGFLDSIFAIRNFVYVGRNINEKTGV